MLEALLILGERAGPCAASCVPLSFSVYTALLAFSYGIQVFCVCICHAVLTLCGAVSDFTGWGRSVLQDTPHFSHQLQALEFSDHLYFLPTGYKSEASYYLPKFYNLLEWLRDFKKALYTGLYFYHKAYKLEPAKWRDTQDDVWEDPKQKCSPSSECMILLAHQ